MKRCAIAMLVLFTLAGCGGPARPTPDLVATQIAVEEAAHATMTAKAPKTTEPSLATKRPEPTATPSAAPAATSTPTAAPTEAPTDTPTPTPSQTVSPTPSPTSTLAPTSTPSPAPTPTPRAKPTSAPTALPASSVVSLDKYKVYYSNFQGKTVADEQNALNYGVWSMRGDGEEATMLFAEALQPALSVDGKKLAYTRISTGIVVYDLTTGVARDVINHSGADTPSFSPDGYRLAYAEYTVVTWWDVFSANSMVHIASVDRAFNASALAGRRPAWSPTSNLIVYEACEGTKCGLLLLNADNGHTRFLVGDSAGKASWSPDGQKITYSTDADGDSEIWSINLDGTGAKKLTDNQSTDALASWSPDGKVVYLLSDRAGGWAIWAMNPDGTDQRRVKSIGVPQYWQWAKMSVGWNK